MGGYISSLGLVAGKILFKSLYIHEQNSILGTSNNIAKNFAKKVFTGFKLDLSNEYNSGNPIRKEIRGSSYFDFPDKDKILIIGGSQGSKFFKDNFPQELVESDISEKIIFQKGSHILNFESSNIEFIDFIDDISKIFAKTKFVICRSGASTVAELQSYGMPALFFPLPNSIDNHQKYNATFAAKDGGREVKVLNLLLRFHISISIADATSVGFPASFVIPQRESTIPVGLPPVFADRGCPVH